MQPFKMVHWSDNNKFTNWQTTTDPILNALSSISETVFNLSTTMSADDTTIHPKPAPTNQSNKQNGFWNTDTQSIPQHQSRHHTNHTQLTIHISHDDGRGPVWSTCKSCFCAGWCILLCALACTHKTMQSADPHTHHDASALNANCGWQCAVHWCP